MELTQAKEILILNIQEAQGSLPADVKTALVIGVNAITRVLTMRSYNIGQALLPLKGETSRGGVPISPQILQKLRESPLGKEPGD